MTSDVLQSVFDSLAEPLAVLDYTGTLLATNETWQRFAQGSVPFVRGDSGNDYLELCRTATGAGVEAAEAWVEGLKAVLEGRRASFDLEYRRSDSAGRAPWFELSATLLEHTLLKDNPLKTENKQPYVIVRHQDVTRRKQAETRAQRLTTFQNVLVQLTNDLLTTEVTPAVYQRLLEQTVALIPGAQVGSVLVRQADDRFHFVAAHGFDLAKLGSLSLAANELYHLTRQPPKQTPYLAHKLDSIDLTKLDHERLAQLRRAATTPRLKAVLTRSRSYSRWPRLLPTLRIEATLGVPIYIDGNVTALLSLDNLETGDAFTDLDRQLAESLASRLGLLLRRSRSEQLLRDKERRLRLHVEQSPLAVIEWSLDATVTAWNPAAEGIFGYSAADVIGKRAAALIVPAAVRPQTDEVWAALIENRGGYRSINENVTREGRIIVCAWYNTPLVASDGAVIGVASLAQDISERVQAEERFRKAFQFAPVATGIIRLADGRLLDVNDSFCDLTGFAREALLQKTMLELGLLVDESDFSQLIARLEEQGSLHELELRIRNRSGELRHLLGSVVTLEFGGEPCALSMFFDISVRKRTEEQLSQAIQEVLGSSSGLGHAVMERLAKLKAGTLSPAELADLTEREREVLTLLAKGWDNRQIATELGLGKTTVRNYVSSVYSKLGLRSRAEAVVWARERGLVT